MSTLDTAVGKGLYKHTKLGHEERHDSLKGRDNALDSLHSGISDIVTGDRGERAQAMLAKPAIEKRIVFLLVEGRSKSGGI